MRDEKTGIHYKAAQIMQQIKFGRLYDEPINLFNPDEILVAAYLLGRRDAITSINPEFADLPAKP